MTDPDPDLDDWLAALAGRGGRLGPGAAEAAAIRAAVLAGPAEPLASAAATETTAPVGPAGDRGLVALMERLRREGLLEGADPRDGSQPPPADRSIRRFLCPARLAWAGSFALAAGLALMVVVSALLEEPPAPPLVAQQSADFDAAPRLRTGPGPQQAGTATPAQLARLIERLKAERLPYRLRAVGTGWRLDFYVPDESRVAASLWLNAESIAIPPTGWVRLETAKPPA